MEENGTTISSRHFFPVEMDGVVLDEPVVFYMADFRKLLPHVIESCPNYAALIQAALQNQPNLAFNLVLYNDEATGGNILQPDSKKRCPCGTFYPQGDFLAMVRHSLASFLCRSTRGLRQSEGKIFSN